MGQVSRVYTMAKTSIGENFKHGCKNDIAPNMATFFLLGEFSGGQVSWVTSNPWTRNSASRELQLEDQVLFLFLLVSFISIKLFSSCPPYQLLPQITLFWTWNSWPIAALLHYSLNQLSKPVHKGSHVTWGQFVQSQLLRTWKLGLTTSHGIPSFKSHVCHGCIHGNKFWRRGLGLILRVGLSKKLDPTLNTKPRECLCII